MERMLRRLLVPLILILLVSCSRRNHPSRNAEAWAEYEVTPIRTASVHLENPSHVAEVAKPAIILPGTKQTEVFPNVITVNDKVAHRSVDGRYYFDVDGHRYWRNKYDGKYYLFNKSMYNNAAFAPSRKK